MGWPEDEQVTISEVAVVDQVLTAMGVLGFTEVIPSSCADLPHKKSQIVPLKVRLDARSGEARVVFGTCTSGDPLDDWDLGDLNSAADGR